ncbi:DUF3006 domain-containing protein [Salinarchaeum laminariae]|uniref:DUF3006 domain-containing protein n=1 Tax=Salinarchaeum laminariae TaxID=869888 RepID=UPI0020BEA95B|nr:DUF3006 domain-containing protein [Salinarchaeum laminariae]
MFRRDVLATLLSMFSVSSVQALIDEIEAAMGGHHADGGDAPDPNADDSEPNDNDAEDDGTDAEETESNDPGTRTAVVDRIENETAVVIFDDGSGTETVPAAVLPEAARKEGMVLDVPEGTSLALATVDRAETAKRRQEAQDRFDELSEQPPESDAGGNETASP